MATKEARLELYRVAKVGDIWFRVEDRWQGCFDEDGEPYSTSYLRLHIKNFVVRKRTPTGVQLGQVFANFTGLHSPSRFLGDGWTRRYASPTLELAYEDLLERRKAQEAIYTKKLYRIQRARAAISVELNKLKSNLKEVRPDLFASPKFAR